MANTFGCMHRRIRVEHTYTGTRSFYGGETFDNIREVAQFHCLDCDGWFSEQEIRTSWNGYSTYAAILEEQDEIR